MNAQTAGETDTTDGPPDLEYFTLFGEIRPTYGGITTAALRRAAMLRTFGGVTSTILTMDHRRDYRAVEAEMLGDGRLAPGSTIRNMWDELATLVWSDVATGPEAQPEVEEHGRELIALSRTEGTLERFDSAIMRRVLRGPGDRVEQADYLRGDGSPIALLRHRYAPDGKRSASVLRLLDSSGRVVRDVANMDGLRRLWLDLVTAERPSVLFCDPFGLATFAMTYRRSHVCVIFGVHNNLAEPGATSAFSPTQARFGPIVRNLDSFDSVVVLTERQRRDLGDLLGPSQRVFVASNSCDPPPKTPSTDRPARHGAIVARLVPSKQIDHAILAIARANESLGAARRRDRVTLDIIGNGDERPMLERLSRSSGQRRNVSFFGYRRDAAEAFAAASFFLLTSTTEAFGLTLIEAMARGCVPIAYDIRYGPGDIISHGVNGLLVEPNNLGALAAAVVRFVSMDEASRTAMRAAAVTRAEDFSPRANYERWCDTLGRSWSAKADVRPLSAVVEHTTLESADGSIGALVVADRPLVEPMVHLMVEARGRPELVRVAAKITPAGSNRLEVSAVIEPTKVEWMSAQFVDLWWVIADAHGRVVVRARSLDDDDPPRMTVGEYGAYRTAYGNLSLKR